MGIRVMGMRMGQIHMLMNMGMGSLDRWLVLVRVVFVMDVLMIVFQGFMGVDMLVTLGQVHVDPAPHEDGSCQSLHRQGLLSLIHI